MYLQSVEKERQICENILGEMRKVIVGKEEQLRLLLICLLSKGHLLIEDVPGVGKTTAASAMARATGLEAKRVQFTPDVMATDITGFTAPNGVGGEFVYKPGACMTNIFIADEINRTSPKTQSALLEVMEERQVTVDGVTYPLPQPFMVVATQNPLGYIGTYPLPEAQLDRFLMKSSMGYPSAKQEIEIIGDRQAGNPLDAVVPVSSAEEIVSLQNAVEQIYVDESVRRYIVELVCATRQTPMVALAASPRASLALMRAAAAKAMLDGRTFVLPRDVSELYESIVAHRLMLSPEAKIERTTAAQILETLKAAVKAPIVK